MATIHSIPNVSTYSYSPLDNTQSEIRVLIIHAGCGEDPVQTTLRPISLHRPCKYETISYVWGDARRRAQINIDGKALNVPASAERVIRRMRTDSDRTIWIDAVCINQESLQEREEQVSLMGDVYRKTSHNLVWLDKSQDSTEAAVEAIDAIYNDIIQATNNLETFYEFISTAEFSRYSESHEHCPHNVMAVLQFFDNTWFKRLWCVQEVALPPSSTIHCGNFEISLLKLLRVAEWCWNKMKFLALVDPRQPFAFNDIVNKAFKNPRLLFSLVDPRFGHLERHWSENTIATSLSRLGLTDDLGSPEVVLDEFPTEFPDSLDLSSSPTSSRLSRRPIHSLLHLLDYSTQFETTVPQDRIFAVLGLVQKYTQVTNSEFLTLLKPDYKKPMMHVARDATRAAIIEAQSLRVLSKVYHTDSDNPDSVPYPSWVPRLQAKWDRSINATPLLHDSFEAYPREDSTHDVDSYFTEDHDMLSLKGFFVDSISGTSPIFTSACLDEISTMTEQIRAINDMMRLAESENPQQIVEAVARILVATKTPHETGRIYNTFLGWASTIRKHSVGRFRSQWTDDPEAQAELNTQNQYNDDVIRHCTNRRFFHTPNGFMGLGPREMSGGDVIVVVPGYPLPLILRPTGKLKITMTWVGDRFEEEYAREDGTPDVYTFIGDCYVDRIMHGTLVTAYQELGIADFIFNIR